MVQIKSLQSTCRRMKSTGKDREAILMYLRAKGCSKIDSIRVIIAVLDLDLEGAKRIVHLSRAWADVRDRDNRFHDSLKKVAKRRLASSPRRVG